MTRKSQILTVLFFFSFLAFVQGQSLITYSDSFPLFKKPSFHSSWKDVHPSSLFLEVNLVVPFVGFQQIIPINDKHALSLEGSLMHFGDLAYGSTGPFIRPQISYMYGSPKNSVEFGVGSVLIFNRNEFDYFFFNLKLMYRKQFISGFYFKVGVLIPPDEDFDRIPLPTIVLGRSFAKVKPNLVKARRNTSQRFNRFSYHSNWKEAYHSSIFSEINTIYQGYGFEQIIPIKGKHAFSIDGSLMIFSGSSLGAYFRPQISYMYGSPKNTLELGIGFVLSPNNNDFSNNLSFKLMYRKQFRSGFYFKGGVVNMLSVEDYNILPMPSIVIGASLGGLKTFLFNKENKTQTKESNYKSH